jgi:hypothetical protein
VEAEETNLLPTPGSESRRGVRERIVARPTLFDFVPVVLVVLVVQATSFLALTPLSLPSFSLSTDSASVAAPALDYIPRTFNAPFITHYLSPANYTTWTYPAPE